MAILNDLVVRLGLDGSKFQNGLRNAIGQTKSFASSFKSLINPAMATFAAGTATAGVAVYALTGRIAKLAGVADKAVQTGLSGEFIQRLGYAADQSGVSAETLTASINKMTVAIGKGGKEFEHLKGLNPEQQFLSIADKISKLPTHAQRAAAAVKIFGRSGIEMTGLFAGGLNDVNKLLNDAKKLGIGLSEQALAKAAKADDAIQRMYASFGALFDQVAVGVAPIFDKIATAIGNWIPPFTAFMDKFNELPDKITFIKDLLSASFDVAFFTIKEKWSDMLKDMLAMSVREFKKINDVVFAPVNPFAAARVAGRVAGGLEGAGPQADNLGQAQKRLDELINKLRPEAPVAQMPFVGPRQKQADDGNKLRELVGNIWDKVAPIADQAKFAADGVFDRMKIKFGAVAQFFERLFTGTPAEKARQPETKLAGAMQRGSEEAYSTLVNAMMRTKDPVVRATEKASQAVVKAIKQKKEIKLGYLEAFEGVARA